MPLKVKTLIDLVSIRNTKNNNSKYFRQRCLYLELSRGEQILGINSSMTSSPQYALSEAERMILGEKVLSKNYAPIAQEFLKKGCPQCLRDKIWRLILGAEAKSYVSCLCVLAYNVLK